MSLIHVSSQGDKGGSSTRFSNFFPNPIIIEPNSQVALVNIILSPNGNVVIDETNNTLIFAIGSVIGGKDTVSPQNRVVIASGEYTADELAVLITDGMNALTFQGAYYKFADPTGGGWLVTVIKVDEKPSAFKFQNTQNDQPALKAYASRTNWEATGGTTYAADQLEYEDITTSPAVPEAPNSFFGVYKADVAANTNKFQQVVSNKMGLFRGLKGSNGLKPYIEMFFDTYDAGGGADSEFGEVVYGWGAHGLWTSGADNFDVNLQVVRDLAGNIAIIPIFDVAVRLIPTGTAGDSTGAIQVWVKNGTTNEMEQKPLTGIPSGNKGIVGDETGHTVKIEWNTNKTVRVYYRRHDGSSWTAYGTAIYSGTKQYGAVLNQLKEQLYIGTKTYQVGIRGIYNPTIMPNVRENLATSETTSGVLERTFTTVTADLDDSGLTAYRNQNIAMSVGQLNDQTILTEDGNIGETIGANSSLIQLTRTDATNQVNTYTTSGRPSFHGNLATAHVQLNNLPIKSFMGACSNIGKDIAVIPRFESSSQDPSDTLYYEPSEKIWIDLKNSEQITSNEITMSIKDSLNRELEGIHQPTAATIMFRTKKTMM
tara:strand:- start:10275 stop:12065 length:1791 start_codon:yes stop_codon:yes gene_type:complete